MASATLLHALDSIAVQTRLPEEVLLVDDGNAPEEAQRLLALADRHPTLRARVIRLPENRGPGSARNAGWAAARSPLIAFLDADDLWHPRKLELQAALMQADPELALSGHAWRVLAAGEALPEEPRGSGRQRAIGGARLLVVNPITPTTWMVRRAEAVRFVEGKRHVEDHLLLMELALRGRRLAALDLELGAQLKPALSRSGLSSQLWAMERGELDAYARLRASGLLGGAAWTGLSALSLLKFLRRVAVVKLLR